MLKSSSIFFMSPRTRKTSMSAEDIATENKKKNKAKQIPTPHVGPRLKLYYYIYDEKMTIKEAAWKILKEFSAINIDDIIRWYNEEENRRLKERSNSNEAR